MGLGTRDSARGLGVLFGQVTFLPPSYLSTTPPRHLSTTQDVTAAFLERNRLQCLVRSHEEIRCRIHMGNCEMREKEQPKILDKMAHPKVPVQRGLRHQPPRLPHRLLRP